MPAIIGSGVTLRGLFSEDFSYTWLITGTGGVAPGYPCAMTQDTAAANSAKVTADGSIVLGALRSYENRIQEGIVTGAIGHKGNFVFKYTGTAPVIGNAVVGSATAGKVKDSGAVSAYNRVVEVDQTATEVTVMIG